MHLPNCSKITRRGAKHTQPNFASDTAVSTLPTNFPPVKDLALHTAAQVLRSYKGEARY
jgi:hypothetical protein